MEDWQENVISENLTKLVELTDCSTGLLNRLKEQKVLSREDVEKISACKTELEKSDQLYKIIVKRANAFDILVKALEDTTQSGAAIILTTKSNRNVEKPVVKDTQEPKPRKKLQDLNNKTTFQLYWKGSKLTSNDDAKTILNAVGHKMASKVFRSQACNDMLTIIPDFRFEETDTDELKLKPVTPSAWTQKFIDILAKSVILVDCLNILCNLHKYDQRNYQALIVDLFETLRPEVEVREI